MNPYFDPWDHLIDPPEKIDDNDPDSLCENEIPDYSFSKPSNASGRVNDPTPKEDPQPSTPSDRKSVV